MDTVWPYTEGQDIIRMLTLRKSPRIHDATKNGRTKAQVATEQSVLKLAAEWIDDASEALFDSAHKPVAVKGRDIRSA